MCESLESRAEATRLSKGAVFDSRQKPSRAEAQSWQHLLQPPALAVASQSARWAEASLNLICLLRATLVLARSTSLHIMKHLQFTSFTPCIDWRWLALASDHELFLLSMEDFLTFAKMALVIGHVLEFRRWILAWLCEPSAWLSAIAIRVASSAMGSAGDATQKIHTPDTLSIKLRTTNSFK